MGRDIIIAPIRVLHVASALDGGGVAQMLVNYYKHLMSQDIMFDFIVHGQQIGTYEKFFLGLGSHIFHVPPKRSKPLANAGCISKIIRRGNYDVVHAHQNLSSVVPLLLAKQHKVPVRISHGHGYPAVNAPLAFLARRGIQVAATDYFACTNDVGKWLHPQQWDRKHNRSFVMQNAFELSRYSFDQAARERWRRRLEVGSSKLLVQVGRLSPEKNHSFTITLLDRLRSDAPWKLVIVGEGRMGRALKKQACDLDLTNDVIFLGYEEDIPGILSAGDVAVMPSFNEGLGMAAIEAQASGLPTVVSDALSLEVQVSDLIHFLPLESSEWVKTIANITTRTRGTETSTDERLQAYAIEPAAEEYLRYIQRALKRSKNITK